MQTIEWQAEDLVTERVPALHPYRPAERCRYERETFVPPGRGAARQARRIALGARREQERHLTGW